MTLQPTLGTFLRTRRERLTPDDVGLPAAGRRRTPGLRREELATLAGISADYLVRLEQGRDRRPSPEVLAALARVLRLDRTEHLHLLRLASIGANPSACPPQRPTVPPSPAMLDLVDRLAAPAVVLEPSADVVAWNIGAEALLGPVGALDGTPPNLARHLVLSPTARSAYPEWDSEVRHHAGRLHAAASSCAIDERLDAVVNELIEGDGYFARLWHDHVLTRDEARPVRLAHPEVGHLRLTAQFLTVDDGSNRQLVTYLPADAATAAALDALDALDAPRRSERGPRLRAV